VAYGLRTYTAGGAIAVDISDRLTRSVSSHTVYLDNSSTTIYVPGMVDDGTWAVFCADPRSASGAIIYNGYFIGGIKRTAATITFNVLRV
jgi:hypothetical protein